jgi:CpeS-like protein
MDIVEFFQRSSGKWFSQRTSHDLAFKQTAGQSELQIELLPKTDPAVVNLCEQYNIDPTLALCGARVRWDGTTEQDQAKHTGNTVLVPIANPDSPNEGQLLRERGSAEKALLAGRYSVGSDEALTLIAESETMYSEERLWFANPNLRFRTSILNQSDGFSSASFCSEIRKGVTSPPPAATQSITEKKN